MERTRGMINAVRRIFWVLGPSVQSRIDTMIARTALQSTARMQSPRDAVFARINASSCRRVLKFSSPIHSGGVRPFVFCSDMTTILRIG